MADEAPAPGADTSSTIEPSSETTPEATTEPATEATQEPTAAPAPESTAAPTPESTADTEPAAAGTTPATTVSLTPPVATIEATAIVLDPAATSWASTEPSTGPSTEPSSESANVDRTPLVHDLELHLDPSAIERADDLGLARLELDVEGPATGLPDLLDRPGLDDHIVDGFRERADGIVDGLRHDASSGLADLGLEQDAATPSGSAPFAPGVTLPGALPSTGQDLLDAMASLADGVRDDHKLPFEDERALYSDSDGSGSGSVGVPPLSNLAPGGKWHNPDGGAPTIPKDPAPKPHPKSEPGTGDDDLAPIPKLDDDLAPIPKLDDDLAPIPKIDPPKFTTGDEEPSQPTREQIGTFLHEHGPRGGDPMTTNTGNPEVTPSLGTPREIDPTADPHADIKHTTGDDEQFHTRLVIPVHLDADGFDTRFTNTGGPDGPGGLDLGAPGVGGGLDSFDAGDGQGGFGMGDGDGVPDFL